MLTPIIHDSLETCTFLPGWGFDVNVRSGIEIGPQSYALGPNRGSVYCPDRRPQQIRRPGGGAKSGYEGLWPPVAIKSIVCVPS